MLGMRAALDSNKDETEVYFWSASSKSMGPRKSAFSAQDRTYLGSRLREPYRHVLVGTQTYEEEE